MKEADLVIDTEEIAEFFYLELIKRGYIPSELETLELADITFEYLLKKSMIVEEEAL
ncbi:YozD family protein [Bacillus sp. NPDC077027]|uniref:YozD family protein n=1 Tax=Bacillus sp. NPDC077027 TaxID=3390548 RepID=UPI003D067C7D